jgi:hypothetical protein
VTTPRRRPLDQLSPTTRVAIAIVGLVVGFVLVFIGARSCETSLEDDPVPVGVTEAQSNPN